MRCGPEGPGGSGVVTTTGPRQPENGATPPIRSTGTAPAVPHLPGLPEMAEEFAREYQAA